MSDEQKPGALEAASRVVASGLLTAEEAFKASMQSRGDLHAAGLQQVIDEVRAAMACGDTSCTLSAPVPESVRRFLQGPPYLYRFSGEGQQTVSWQPAYPVHLQEG